MRKLASIQTIIDLQPIDGADNIELASILGWHVVVKKNEFNIGSKCIYFEIDSIIPYDKEECFAFLEKCKGRIKTQKLRGVYSQGLAMPLNNLPDSFIDKYYKPYNNWDKLEIGTDVTDDLGVTKYDPEALISVGGGPNNTKQRTFPDYIEKSDETRIQGMFSAFILLKEKMLAWYKENLYPFEKLDYVDGSESVYTVTEKVDGTSCTISVTRKDNYDFTFFQKILKFFGYKYPVYITKVCSRNQTVSNGLDSKENDSYYTIVNNKYNVIRKLMEYMDEHPDFKWIALQGEILGPGIQGNKYKLDTHIWKVFNMQYETYNGIIIRHADWNTLTYICQKLNLLQVDRLMDIELKLLDCENIDDIVELSIGKSNLNPSQEREGIVVRYYPDNMSWKCISPKFLLKNDL